MVVTGNLGKGVIASSTVDLVDLLEVEEVLVFSVNNSSFWRNHHGRLHLFLKVICLWC